MEDLIAELLVVVSLVILGYRQKKQSNNIVKSKEKTRHSQELKTMSQMNLEQQSQQRKSLLEPDSDETNSQVKAKTI